jgi:hypothetical protein
VVRVAGGWMAAVKMPMLGQLVQGAAGLPLVSNRFPLDQEILQP